MRTGLNRGGHAERRLLLLIGILGMGCVTADVSPVERKPDELRLRFDTAPSEATAAGTWEAEGKWLTSPDDVDALRLTLIQVEPGRAEKRSTLIHDLRLYDGDASQTVRGPAGTLTLGLDSGKTGGSFVLQPAAQFMTQVQAAGMARPSGLELAQLVCFGVEPDYVVGVNHGSRGLDWEEFIKLHTAGVTLAFVEAVRQPARMDPVDEGHGAEPLPPVEYSVDDIVMLNFRGVSADYITALRNAGYRFTAREMANMKFRGVPAAFATEVRAAGYDLTASELSDLRFRGVSTEYMVRLRRAGYRFSPKELADLHFRGVSAAYAEALVQPGYQPLGAQEIVKLRFSGVDPALVRALRPATPPEPAIALEHEPIP